MNIARKLALAVVAGGLSLGFVGFSAPTVHAADTSWGCGGGSCAHAPVLH